MSFPMENVASWVARRAVLTPARVALVCEGRRYTYAELDDRAARAASVLAGLGVGPGDRVAALLPNGVEYVDVFLGCARLGAILVPLSQRLAPPELEFMVEDAGASVLVSHAEFAEQVKAFRPATGLRHVLSVDGGEDPSYERALENAPRAGEPLAVAPDDVLAIFYTSGTTGRPKGAMLTHGNFFWTNLNILLALDFTQEERSLVVLPMFHVGGWNVNTLSVWLKGGTVHLERAFKPAGALVMIEDERLTSLMGVPTIYRMLADQPGFAAADLSSLAFCVCGGAPLPVDLIRLYQDRGVRFIQGYGLTEAAPNCLALPPEDSVRKAGSAGRPYVFADVRVVDAEDRDVRPGGSGEIIVGGPSIMKGYWRRPDATAEALRGGWLRTGDVARVDEDGYITIIDRVKDMFISGGENVYPAEVENVLAGHPAVADAAVIGVPDPKWGEVGHAIIVLRAGAQATEEDLRSFCGDRLAKFKVPAGVVFTEEPLPRNPTGKLLKPEIRERWGR